jgi:monofunctional biosynthetic peptidoglycan transglycosylase
LATYLGGCILALGAYSAVFPPITGVQVQRSLEVAFDDTQRARTYTPIPLSAMDRSLLRAVVAGEDSRFFLHGGIDWEAVGEAIEEYQNGEDLRGASSITQQLVKNLFMTTHSTYLRKALEVPLAYAAELVLSKRRILELYLNVIEWGPNVYGAEAAAKHYYGTSAQHLSRGQAAALAACIPNPRVRRPDTVGWYQRIILRRMDNLPPLPLS